MHLCGPVPQMLVRRDSGHVLLIRISFRSGAQMVAQSQSWLGPTLCLAIGAGAIVSRLHSIYDCGVPNSCMANVTSNGLFGSSACTAVHLNGTVHSDKDGHSNKLVRDPGPMSKDF